MVATVNRRHVERINDALTTVRRSISPPGRRVVLSRDHKPTSAAGRVLQSDQVRNRLQGGGVRSSNSWRRNVER
jgi:hypothetical protein